MDMSFTISPILALLMAAAQAPPINPSIFQEPQRTEVATAGYPTRGPATAPVTIVEFSDFECPFCGRLFPTLKAVEKNSFAGSESRKPFLDHRVGNSVGRQFAAIHITARDLAQARSAF